MNTLEVASRHASTAQYQGELVLEASLADYTTWRVGGSADALYKPVGISDLARFLSTISPDEPLFWLGLGSNTLIRDKGIRGTVILTQNYLNQIEAVDSETIRVEAGVSCAKMARFSARNGLAGGEFWAGIPGTMGGALRMNAGCFNGETWPLVIEVETINRQGDIRRRNAHEFEFSYRQVSGLAQDEWFLSATCRLLPGDKATSLETIKTLLARRAQTQPTGEYNCGSVFRNPTGHYAAELIESCALKGRRIGGAVVSDKHANFIINHEGHATAADIECLIRFVQDTVYERTSIELVCEVQIVGES